MTTGLSSTQKAKGGDQKIPAMLGKADVSVDAAAWHAEWKKNEKAARAKYQNKIIEVSGIASIVAEDPAEIGGYIHLEVKDDFLGVRTLVTDKKPWLKVAVRSPIKIKGRVPEFGLPGDLFEAEIVEPGPKPEILMAEQIAKDYSADRKLAVEKYNDRWVNVEGDIVEKGKSEFCEIQIKLRGDKDILVSCCFGQLAGKKGLHAAKPGSKISVFGQLSMFDSPTDKIINLNTCALTEVK